MNKKFFTFYKAFYFLLIVRISWHCVICYSDQNLLLFVIDQMCSHLLNVNWTNLLFWLWQNGYVLYAYDKIKLISDFLVPFRIDVCMRSMYAWKQIHGTWSKRWDYCKRMSYILIYFKNCDNRNNLNWHETFQLRFACALSYINVY